MAKILVLFAVLVLGTAAANLLDTKPPSPGSHEMKSLFMLAHDYHNFNHGSFGSPPRYVIERQRAYQDECEARPDRWMRGGYEAYLEKLRLSMAEYLNVKDKGRTLVFVENASSGVNAVMRSLGLKQGDEVLYLSTAYGMVKNTADYLRQEFGVKIIEIAVRFAGNGTAPTDVKGRSVEDAVRDALTANPAIRLAVFSQIASVPAWILPVENLASICSAANIPVFVDGAHALGQVRVDISALAAAGVTYWVGNGHKWLYSPKGSAVMWVAPAVQDTVAPTVISSAYQTGVVDEHSAFLNHFQYTGTRDYTPFVAMLDALAFRAWIGNDVIHRYNHQLAVWAQDRLADIWNTETLMPAHLTGFMGHARFPVDTVEEMTRVDTALFNNYGIEVTTFPLVDPVTNATTIWIRLSAQLYLNEDDIEFLGHTVLHVVNNKTMV